jgi:hypothetical protein
VISSLAMNNYDCTLPTFFMLHCFSAFAMRLNL